LFLFIALTGCRPNEAGDLEVRDVAFQSDEVTFRDTKNRLDHTLPLTPYLRELLRHRVDAAISSRIFSSPYDGRALSNYRAAVRRVREESKVVFTLQDLRRLAATAMERGHVPVYTLKAVLNHLSGNDTTAGYVQVGRDMKLNALRKIEDFVMAHERARSAAALHTRNESERFGGPVHLHCTWQADGWAGLPAGHLRVERVSRALEVVL
jgi:integrase